MGDMTLHCYFAFRIIFTSETMYFWPLGITLMHLPSPEQRSIFVRPVNFEFEQQSAVAIKHTIGAFGIFLASCNGSLNPFTARLGNEYARASCHAQAQANVSNAVLIKSFVI